MQVSILIATRDRPAALLRCLDSVATQAVAPLEVLVVDDASPAPLDKQSLRSHLKNIPLRVFRTQEQRGPIGCRNLLMQEAKGSLLLVLDDDACLASTEVIGTIQEAFANRPEAGILAFKLIERVGSAERLLLPHGRRAFRKNPRLVEETTLVSHYLAGGHALRSEVFRRCGHFPPDMVYGHEELDLSYRALDAGFTILYLPEVVVYHLPDTHVPHFSPWKIRYSLRNRILVAGTFLPLRYLPTHLAIWFCWYGLHALRRGSPGAFFRGLWAGVASLSRRPRQRLRPQTIAYLKEHFGRLWW